MISLVKHHVRLLELGNHVTSYHYIVAFQARPVTQSDLTLYGHYEVIIGTRRFVIEDKSCWTSYMLVRLG